jgi:hypothetical protein
MTYHAFISYSHAADERLAPAIQSGLQRLARPFYRLRALNVFRDKTGLAATPGLWSAIEAALQESAHFILLASPESARSEWVGKEVAWWLQNRSIDTLLIVLTGGELMWNATMHDFDEAHSSAIPGLLHGSLREEPLYVDLRWARSPGELTLYNPRFLDAILDLAAPLHGRAKNDLAGEDVRQSRIVRTLSISVALALALLAGVAWQQRSVAQRNEALATERQLLAEQRLKELCSAWHVTTAFMDENFPAAIYDIKGRLHEAFAFDETCRP